MPIGDIVKRASARAGRGLAARQSAVDPANKQLAADVAELKAAVQELRGLGTRVAEIADLVTELLVLASTRDDPEFKALVAKYREGV